MQPDSVSGRSPLKKAITYSVIFVAVFLLGLLLAFVWGRFISKKHAEPPQPPAHVSAPTSTTMPSNSSIPTLTSRPETTVPSHVTPIVTDTPHGQPAPRPEQAGSPAQPVLTSHNIILLIDSSGSMKKTDPRSYRKEAAALFISLLGKNDRVGIISFGDSATVLMPPTPNTPENRAAMLGAVRKVSSKALTTDITAAVQKGFDELRPLSEGNRALIMLSDGKIDLTSGEKNEASSAALRRLLPELIKADIPIYTVAFTDESDRTLLEHMARETNGFFRFAREDKDVHMMFAAIFEKIKSPDSVPFDKGSFTIDPEIREATVLVTKNAGAALSLMDPSGAKHSAAAHAAHMTWFQSSVFDMITIQAPPAGVWNVTFSRSEGNKIYVLTQLGLKTSFDKSFVNRGERVLIDAWLEKPGGIVTEKDVLESTAFSAEIASPDGKTANLDLSSNAASHGAPQTPGTYTGAILFSELGDYSIKLQARGRTFKREKTLSLKAIEPVAKPVAQEQTPPAATPSPTRPEAVSWTQVLLKFAIINLIIAVLTAGGLLLRKKGLSKRKRHD